MFDITDVSPDTLLEFRSTTQTMPTVIHMMPTSISDITSKYPLKMHVSQKSTLLTVHSRQVRMFCL